MNMSENQETPSIIKMIASFTKETAKWIANGAQVVSETAYTKRLGTCLSCPKLIYKSMRCSACGCKLENKAKWKTAECPEGKWPKE